MKAESKGSLPKQPLSRKRTKQRCRRFKKKTTSSQTAGRLKRLETSFPFTNTDQEAGQSIIPPITVQPNAIQLVRTVTGKQMPQHAEMMKHDVPFCSAGVVRGYGPHISLLSRSLGINARPNKLVFFERT